MENQRKENEEVPQKKQFISEKRRGERKGKSGGR